MSRIIVNDLGRAVAYSGLLPATAHYFIDFLRTHIGQLGQLLPTANFDRDGRLQDSSGTPNGLDIAFVLTHLCFTSPEFRGGGVEARRQITYQLDERRESPRAVRLDSLLAIRPWDRDAQAANATDLTMDWISGIPIIDLERHFQNLRAGVLRDMYRTVVSHLTGMADIVAGMIVASDGGQLGSDYSWVTKQRTILFRIVRRSR